MQTQTITKAAEELKSRILTLQNTSNRFRLGFSTENAVTILTAAYAAEVERRHNTLILDNDTCEHIAALADELTKPVPHIGIALCGSMGNGKTTLLYALRTAILTIRALGETGEFANVDSSQYRDGLVVVDALRLSSLARSSEADYERYRAYPRLAIEDAGTEPAEVSTYGNIVNPVAGLLEYRYDRQLFTVITTNLTPTALGEKYGGRCADRFKEMIRPIPFLNPSYRK